MMAWAAASLASGERSRAAYSSGTPASMTPTFSVCPMTPVEHTSTSSGAQPTAFAAAAHMRSAFSSPWGAQALAGTNDLQIFVCGSEEQVLLAARLDNLGKGSQTMGAKTGFLVRPQTCTISGMCLWSRWTAARLDNLGKGASGAAVQNMNIMLGFPEEAGLTDKEN